jgi:hypothetical protein
LFFARDEALADRSRKQHEIPAKSGDFNLAGVDQNGALSSGPL